jgi:hypothetical protein
LLIALICAFTSAWSTASRALWQHGASMLMLALALNWQVRMAIRLSARHWPARTPSGRPTCFRSRWGGVAWLDPRSRRGAFLGRCVHRGGVRRSYPARLGNGPPLAISPHSSLEPFLLEALGDSRARRAACSCIRLSSSGRSLAQIKLRQRRPPLDLSLALTIVAHRILIRPSAPVGRPLYGPRFFADMLPHLAF